MWFARLRRLPQIVWLVALSLGASAVRPAFAESTESFQADTIPGQLYVLGAPYVGADGKIQSGEIQVFVQEYTRDQAQSVVDEFRKHPKFQIDQLVVYDPDDLDRGRKISSDEPLPDSKNPIEYIFRKVSGTDRNQAKSFFQQMREVNVPPAKRVRKLITIRTIFGTTVSTVGVLLLFDTNMLNWANLPNAAYMHAGIMMMWQALYRTTSSYYGEAIGKFLNFKSLYLPRSAINRQHTLSPSRLLKNFTYETILTSITMLVMTNVPNATVLLNWDVLMNWTNDLQHWSVAPIDWKSANLAGDLRRIGLDTWNLIPFDAVSVKGVKKLFAYGGFMTLVSSIYGTSLEGLSQAGRDLNEFANGDLFRYKRFKNLLEELHEKHPLAVSQETLNTYQKSLDWLASRHESPTSHLEWGWLRWKLPRAVFGRSKELIAYENHVKTLDKIRNESIENHYSRLRRIGYSVDEIYPTPIYLYERFVPILEALIASFSDQTSPEVEVLKNKLSDLNQKLTWLNKKQQIVNLGLDDRRLFRTMLADLERMRKTIISEYERKFAKLEINIEAVDSPALYHRYRGAVDELSNEELARAIEEVELKKSQNIATKNEVNLLPVSSQDFRRMMMAAPLDESVAANLVNAREQIANFAYHRIHARAGSIARDKVSIWVFFATSMMATADILGVTPEFRKIIFESRFFNLTQGNLFNIGTYLTAATTLQTLKNPVLKVAGRTWNSIGEFSDSIKKTFERVRFKKASACPETVVKESYVTLVDALL